MTVQVRRFERGDRDQVAALVNAHIGAVIPNVAVSVNAVMHHLEREPGEFIVDPWVRERVSLVAVQRSRVVAAAHLLRYIDDTGLRTAIGMPRRSDGCCAGRGRRIRRTRSRPASGSSRRA